MEHPYPSAEFEAEIGEDGTLLIPARIRSSLAPGTRVGVRITMGAVSLSLRRRRITEEDIEQIARVQLEPRENVVRFLEAEGSLSRKGRIRSRNDLHNRT